MAVPPSAIMDAAAGCGSAEEAQDGYAFAHELAVAEREARYRAQSAATAKKRRAVQIARRQLRSAAPDTAASGAAREALAAAIDSSAPAPRTLEEEIRVGREHDGLLRMLEVHPGVMPVAAAEAQELARKRARFPDLILHGHGPRLASAPSDAFTFMARTRASGVEEALLDLESPARPPTAAAFESAVADRYDMPPQPYAYMQRDSIVAAALVGKNFALADPGDIEAHDGVHPGVKRSMWEATATAVNGRGQPTYRMGLNVKEVAEPVEGLSLRLQRRVDSAAARAHKPDPLRDVVLVEPPTDTSQEGLMSFLADVGEVTEVVAARCGAPASETSTNWALNTWEEFLRLHGFSLMTLTDRGVPESVRSRAGAFSRAPTDACGRARSWWPTGWYGSRRRARARRWRRGDGRAASSPPTRSSSRTERTPRGGRRTPDATHRTPWGS
jgi:hypothetical protein